jgi:outer membrane protein OmpA-like peptidoglycan-associated protein
MKFFQFLMMAKHIGWCWCVLASIGVSRAQEVQWASKLVGFSSEFRKENVGQEYRAIRALGVPNTIPPFGESACAWSPYNADSNVEEWIRVAFDKPQKARQILIVENFNQGCITQVYAYDAAGKEVSVWTGSGPAASEVGRVLTISVPDSAMLISSVKVALNPARVKGYNQIDAIGLNIGDKPYEPKINVFKDAPKEIIKENLGSGVNTKAQEVAPIISPDGKTIFFTRGKYDQNIGGAETQDVWFSTRQGDTWNEAQNMGAPINNADNNAIVSISPDGKTLYLMNVYRPDGTMTFGLSKATRTKTGWTSPVECKIEDIYNLDKKNNTEFTLSPKGNVLVMSVKRQDTNGDRDLYVSFLKGDATWSKPLNMGSIINTADVESAPFIATDNKTLYFTSYGHAGYGGGDIFMTRRLDESWTKWSQPENLGPAINTNQWDGFLSIPASGEYAYVSSMQNSLGGEDLFRFKVYNAIRPEPVAMISGSVIDADTRKPVTTEIVTNLLKDNSNVSKIEYDPETGEYKIILPVQQSYRLSAIKDGFFPLDEIVDLSKDKRFRDIKRNILLVPIKEGKKITPNGIMFEQSKFELLEESLPDLNRIAEMMLKYTNMELLVEGHTDNQGDFKLNMELSENRVNEVKKYLMSKGVPDTRLQVKGWGSTKPIASNELEETRKKNRRVEFTILKV